MDIYKELTRMDIVSTNLIVKHESDHDTVLLCDGCLSKDRIVKPLKDLAGLLGHVFGHTSATARTNYLLCWECTANIRKFYKFQEKARYAQTLLQQSLYHPEQTLPCLTNLNIKRLESQNVNPVPQLIVEENAIPQLASTLIETAAQKQAPIFPIETPIENKIYPEIPKETDYKIPKEEIFLPETDDFDYDIPLENLRDYDIIEDNPKDSKTDKDENDKEEVKKEKKVKSKKKKKHKKAKLNNKLEEGVKRHPLSGVKKYTGRAKMKKNPHINLVNYEENFIQTAMTEQEIEKLGKSLLSNKKSGIKPVCKTCNRQFVCSIDSKRHKTFCHILKSAESGPYSCLECQTECADKDTLRTHWNDAHNSTFRCKFCKTKVTHAFEYKLHSEQHKYLLKCLECKLPGFNTTFDNNKDFGYHFKTLHRRVLCDYCGRESYTTGALAKHIRKYHLSRTCKICDRTFDKYLAFQRHNISYHPELVERDESEEARYCVECDKHFPSVERYRRHLKATTVHNAAVVKGWRNKVVSCPECGKQFKRNKHMTNHYKLYHERKTDHYCQLCDKYLVSAYRLRTHMASVHLKIRPPKDKFCDLCGRGFGTNAVLKKHMRTHTGERPYKCSLCPAAFTQSHPLKSHLKSQHNVV